MDVRLQFFFYGFCLALFLAALFFHGVLEKVRDRSAKIDKVQSVTKADKELRDQVEELNDRVKK